MSDSNLLQTIKRIVRETVDAEKPCDYIVGTVTSGKPLKIKISNSLILEDCFVDVAERLTNYKVTVGQSEEEKKKVTVYNALEKGDMVLLIRKRRGQKYIVIDRVVSG